MSSCVEFIESTNLGYGFVEKNEYEKRFLVNGPDSKYRHLTEEEISVLKSNGNRAQNWNDVLVSKEAFRPTRIKDSIFTGKIRIGKLREGYLKYHDLTLSTGIFSSNIISCDIGDDCAIVNVAFMSHYIVHSLCILHCIDELQATNHAKFGNGIVKEGEDPAVRVKLNIMNENEGRSILPFDDLICADAMLWADRRDNVKLNASLIKITDNSYSCKRGWYGEIGDHCVVKQCSIIKDAKIGPYSYIKGCNKLKNITVKSSKDSPSQLGEGIELVNGIVGYGCKIFYGCKAIRFVMGENSQLKYGARLINSVLGDNSTLSCCEFLSNLAFPFHEQHHNNSFMISSLVMGQSNMAAGANIGSNHNTRSADGEMRAGRGFWPALSSTIKFDSRFASFCIITKGNYSYELNVKTPFTLLSDDPIEQRRVIMPAYWWMYNMYALERNSEKFKSRDKRVYAKQHIETDYLAPDTVSEILYAIDYLEDKIKQSKDLDNVFADDIENSKIPVRILKSDKALSAYRQALRYYGTSNIVKYCSLNNVKVSDLEKLSDSAVLDWTNLGGQLVPQEKVRILRDDIANNKYLNWSQIHNVYDAWFEEYEKEKAIHAAYILKQQLGVKTLTAELWKSSVEELVKTRSYIDDQVMLTRKKDYENKFRMLTFENEAERDAVLGKLEDNAFIKSSREKTKFILSLAENCIY